MMPVKLDGYIKNENTSILTICTKCRSKWINDLNIKPDILNMKKKNECGNSLELIGIGKTYFLTKSY